MKHCITITKMDRQSTCAASMQKRLLTAAIGQYFSINCIMKNTSHFQLSKCYTHCIKRVNIRLHTKMKSHTVSVPHKVFSKDQSCLPIYTTYTPKNFFNLSQLAAIPVQLYTGSSLESLHMPMMSFYLVLPLVVSNNC